MADMQYRSVEGLSTNLTATISDFNDVQVIVAASTRSCQYQHSIPFEATLKT